MQTQPEIIVDNLLRFTDSLYRELNYQGTPTLAAKEIFRKQLAVLKETRSLMVSSPTMARAIIHREDEIIWAIKRLEDLVSING